jgi:hypothetical protein
MIIGRIGFRFLQIFSCRSKALSTTAAKLIPKAFGTQTIAAVSAPFAKNVNEKSLMPLKPNHAYWYP